MKEASELSHRYEKVSRKKYYKNRPGKTDMPCLKLSNRHYNSKCRTAICD